MPWLIAALCCSVAGIALGGAWRSLVIVVASASSFGALLVAISLKANMPHWRRGLAVAGTAEDPVAAMRLNIRLITIAYIWGGMAMQITYLTALTGLKWQHGSQYAIAMVMLAIGSFQFARGLGSPDHKRRSAWVALGLPTVIANALAAAGGLLYLVSSGKLVQYRSDWAANQVFLFGSLILMVLCGIALKTHSRLTRD